MELDRKKEALRCLESKNLSKRSDSEFESQKQTNRVEAQLPVNNKALKIESSDSYGSQISLACDRCSFSSISNKKHYKFVAKQHAIACSKLKPFSCSACQMTFGRKGNAEMHTTTVCSGAQVLAMERFVMSLNWHFR